MYAVLFVLLHLILPAGTTDERTATEHTFVKVDASLVQAIVHPGGEGTIRVSFTPVDGIHITVDPPLSVRIEKNRFVALKGEPDVSTDKESGFLSTSTPVEQRFRVSPTVQPGAHTIKGTIVYYFCSDTGGWCRKLSQPIRLRLNIQKQ